VSIRIDMDLVAVEFQVLQMKGVTRQPMVHGHRGRHILAKLRRQAFEYEMQRPENRHATELRLADAQRARTGERRQIKFAAALPVTLNDTRIRLSAAKAVDDRFQPGVFECELRLESWFLLRRRQLDESARRMETPFPEARLEVRDRHRLFLETH